MNFFLKTKGSVSIFLVIILVPVIVVCSIFVDASRIELAKALATSSADLTLNTILTQYDTALNESYGLLASSQSIEEFLENAEGYFTTCMVSQGIDTTDAQRYASEIEKLLEGEGQIADFLNVDLSQTHAEATPLDDGDLANAALMKNEVVEFMKYRSPINNITGFMDKMGSVKTQLLEKPMEIELTNKKNRYYEAENELMEKALEVYLKFQEYDSYEITEVYIEEVREYLDGCEDKYKKLHERMIKDWYNTGDYFGQHVFESVDTRVVKNPSPSSGYPNANTARESALENATSGCQEARSNYNRAKNELQTAIRNAGIDMSYKSSDYDIQYWVQVAEKLQEKSVYDNFISAANDLFFKYANLQQTYDNRVTYEEETTTAETTSVVLDKNGKPELDANGKVKWETTTTTTTTKIPVELDAGVITACKNELGTKTGILSEFNGLSIRTISGKLESISTTALAKKVTDRDEADKQIAAIANQLQAYYDKLNRGSTLLIEIIRDMEVLKDLAHTYGETFTAWSGYAADSDKQHPTNEMVDTDLEEIDKIKGGDTREEEFRDMSTYIDDTKVGNLQQRCRNVNALLGSFLKGMDKYQYYGKSIRDIKTYAKFSGNTNIEESRITILTGELEAYSETTWVTPAFTKPAENDLHKVTENNNPELTKHEEEFHEWLYKQFANYDPNQHENGKKQFQKLKDKLKEEEEKQSEEKVSANRSKEEIKGKANLPSGGNGKSAIKGNTEGKESGEKLANASGTTQSLTGEIDFDLRSIFEKIRDNLYFTDYIMSMLSYDTYELEGKYQLLREGKENEDVYQIKDGIISPSNAGTLYAGVEAGWTNVKTTFTENKSLTNQMINLENNFSYGNEAEYILYGNTIAENRAASYVTIYSLRYAINIAPVFGEYWKNTLVEQIANGISLATYGVIPSPLVKMIVCLGVTAAETAVDISYLKAGLPVVFIKRDDDLFLKLEGIEKLTGFSNRKRTEKIVSDMCFSYSDYLYLFLLIASITKSDSIYLRTADVIQCNMQKKQDMSDFLMEKAHVYFKIKADVKVSPLMLGLPMVRKEGASVLDSSSWNSFTYTGIRGY